MVKTELIAPMGLSQHEMIERCSNLNSPCSHSDQILEELLGGATGETGSLPSVRGEIASSTFAP